MATAKLLLNNTEIELEYIDGSIEVEDFNSEINNGSINNDIVISCKFRAKSKTKMKVTDVAI